MMTRTALVCHSPAGFPFDRCVGECPLTSSFAVTPVAEYEPPTRNVDNIAQCRQSSRATLRHRCPACPRPRGNPPPQAEPRRGNSCHRRCAGRSLRRRGTAPGAGSHRPPSSRGPAAAAANTQPRRLGGVGRPSSGRTGRRRRAEADAGSTRRRSGDRGRGLRQLQPRRPHARNRLPRGTAAGQPLAGGCPAHRMTRQVAGPAPSGSGPPMTRASSGPAIAMTKT